MRSSLHKRMLAHLKDQNAMSNKSPLFRLDMKCHGGVTQTYHRTILATEAKIVRLNCNEALRIKKQNPQFILNAWTEKAEVVL